MKILFITQLLPYPTDTGGKIKTYRTLKILSKNHSVDLVCFTPEKKFLRNDKRLKQFCRKVKIFVWPLVTARYKESKAKLIKNIFSLTPFTVYRYDCPNAKLYIETQCKNRKYDLIWIDHTNMAQYLPKTKICKYVLDEHNIETKAKATIARYESSIILRVAFYWETVRLWFYEKRIISKFDFWLAISDTDRKSLLQMGAQENRCVVLPVPFNLLKDGVKKTHKSIILFVGLLSWWPNRDGVCWFYKEMWPKIRSKFPKLEWVIVGDGAKPYMLKWQADNRIKFLGYVPKIEQYLKKAQLLVVPIRMGGGIRIKILTALAANLPVVSTSKGSEGLGLENGKELLTANEPDEFVDNIKKLLLKPKLRQKLAGNGRLFMKKYYCFFQTEKVIDRVLATLEQQSDAITKRK